MFQSLGEWFAKHDELMAQLPGVVDACLAEAESTAASSLATSSEAVGSSDSKA